MKRTITFETGVGDHCFIGDGKRCRWLRTERCGTDWRCSLYEIPLYDGDDGWLRKCSECMAEEDDND